jgi:hypothetical protein
LLEHLELILEVLTLTGGARGEALRLVRHHCVARFVLHDRQEGTVGAEQRVWCKISGYDGVLVLDTM